MSSNQQFDRETIIKAIHATGGKITLAARRVGCTRKTIYDYKKKYTTVAQAIEEARQSFDDELLDAAEAKLRSAVLDGEQWAIKYTLNKKGHSRGYMESRNLKHSGDSDNPVQVVNMTWEQMIAHDDGD